MIEQSQYTYIFQKEGRYYIYNSVTSLFAEISEELYILLQDREYNRLSDACRENLISKKVLVRDVEQLVFYSSENLKFAKSISDESTMSLVLVPTTSCNFKCDYCFEGKKQNKFMTPDIEDAIIGYVSKAKKLENLRLTWYGGESLLALSIMESMYSKLSHIQKLKIDKHTIITNGYLINDNVISYINYSHVNDIQVTLDGAETNHNRTRNLGKVKTDTYHSIIQNIGRLLRECHNLNVRVRVNITNETKEDFMKVYEQLHYEFGYGRLHIYPGFIRKDTSDGKSLCYDSMNSISRFDFYKNLRSRGVDVKYIIEKPVSKGCMMHRLNDMIIGPEGEIYKCWNDVNNIDRVIGHIQCNIIENPSLFMHYVTETHPFASSDCKSCTVFPICNGGCGWYRSKNIQQKCVYNLCPIYKDKKILENLLLASIKNQEIKYFDSIFAL